jgi:8-oxo-dGTP pyrophosphatase MutT (NUDIX family)
MPSSGSGVIRPWQIARSEQVADCRIFKVRKDVTVNPRTGKAHDMYVLEQPNWVNVIPLTHDEQVILVQQWRHGSHTVELETPGGLMDEGETPEQCARRELLEETGYEPGELVRLGTVRPNPAIQNNLQYYMLATNCRKIGEPALDHAEDIVVRLAPLSQIDGMIRSGQITHGIVIGGFYWLLQYRKGERQRGL